MSGPVIVEEVHEEDLNLDEVIKVAGADGTFLSGSGKFRELQAESRAVHIEVPAFFVNVVQMCKRSIKSKVQLKDIDCKLQRTKGELHVTSGAVLEARVEYVQESLFLS